MILDLINKQGITRARVIVQSEVSYLKSIGEIDEAKDMAASWKKAIRQLARPLPFAYHARLFDWVCSFWACTDSEYKIANDIGVNWRIWRAWQLANPTRYNSPSIDKACMAIALRYHADVKLVRKNLIQSLKL